MPALKHSWSRRSRLLRSVGWDDYAILACQIFFTASMISEIIGTMHGFGTHIELLTIRTAEIGLFVCLATTRDLAYAG